MRRGWLACLLAVLVVSPLAIAEEPADKPEKKKPPPPVPGIHWERDFDAGFRRAAIEGRPILLCINALENEGANIRLATDLYRSKEWGTATRGYVAFVCNPNDHDGPDGISTRYPGTRSATAQTALQYVMKRFGKNLISPQHIILEPDGDLAYRKEYYERIVGPKLLETWLARVSPPIAYARASIDRDEDIDALSKAAPEELETETVRWLETNDGYAVVGVLSALDDEYTASRRLTLIRALAKASTRQAPALAYGADERTSYPDEDPDETRAWLETLFAVDRKTAVVAAARALARLPDRDDRDAVLRIWAGRAAELPVPGVADFPTRERARVLEALLLAGDARARDAKVPDGMTEDWQRRLARARQIGGFETRETSNLEEAFRDGRPGVLYRALLDADASEVHGQRALVDEAFHSPRERVRVAAALALLWIGSHDEAPDIADVIARAVFDPVEGPEARGHALERLGDDPGESPEEWAAAVMGRLQEGGGR